MRFLFCLLFPALLFSQKKEFNVHYFGYREGIADRQISAICHERNGAVWLGTERGLFRWDGREMLAFDALFKLPPNTNFVVLAVVEDSLHGLWVAAQQGLFKISADRSRCEKVLNHPTIGLVLDDEKNPLALCQTSPQQKSLFRVRCFAHAPPTVDSLTVPGGAPTQIFPAPGGGWLVQNPAGRMHLLRRGQFSPESFEGMPNPHPFYQHFLRVSEHKTYLLLLGVGEAFTLENGRFLHFKSPSPNPDTAQWNELYQFHAVFARFARENVGIFPKENRIAVGLPTCIEPDRYGNLWCGSRTGVFILSPRQSELQHLPHTLGKSTRTIFTDSSGVWVSTATHGLFWQKNLDSPARCFPEIRSVRALLPLDGARFLMAREDFGIEIFDKKTCRMQALEVVKDGHSYSGISDGRFLWVVRTGLFRFDRRTRAANFFRVNLPGGRTVSPQLDRDGSLLLPTNAGLVSVPIAPDGTPRSAETLIEKVDFTGSLRVGDTLWLGTAGQGLWRFDLPTKKIAARFSTADGLSDNYINCILRDPQTEQLWVSTNRGLSRFDPKNHQFLNFGAADGLQNVEFNTSSAWRDPATGRMFFGGLNGVTHFLPSEIQKNDHPPEVFLSKIVRPGRAGEQFETMHPDRDSLDEMLLEIAPTERFVEFYLASTDMFSPDQNQFFYKLENFDLDWVPAGTNPIVRFTSLEAGDYVFRFKTANRNGCQSLERRLRLRVEPIFYKTWWFAAAVLAMAMGLVVAYFRLKIRQVKQIHRERKRIADDLHDDVAATISQLSMLAKSTAAADDLPENLRKIGSLSDESLSKLADIVWSVDDRRQTLGDLANRLQDQAEMLLQPRRIRLRTEIELAQPERNLKSAVRHHVLLIFKEALHNIVRHTESQVVFLKMENHGRGLSVVIENEFSAIRQVTNSSGKGLESMTGRVQQLGGRFYFDKTETTFRAMFSLPDVFE